jgi:3-hydroxyacyl-CoA dehydrogenase
MSSSLVRTETRHTVLVIFVDNPPVNALSVGVPEGLMAAIEEADRRPDVTAVVIAGAGRTFIAGADITLLEKMAWGDMSGKPDLRPLLLRVEACTKPVVMAIHGTALGGGLELAMAGNYRVAVGSAKMGLPECTLGIIPGAEGTQRLPRLVGVEKALDMVVTSKPISAADALASGLIDRIVEGDLVDGAVAFAREKAAAGATHPVTSRRQDRLGDAVANAPLFEAARALAKKIRRHQPAPLKAIDAIEAATRLPFDEGSKKETALFVEAVATEPAKALIHVFFAERAVSKIPGLPKEANPRPVARVGIIGAGTMGSAIAMACTNAGLEVLITDESQAGLDRGFESMRKNYAISVTRGRFTEAGVTERMARVRPAASLAELSDVDVIVEAVFEDLALKQRLFAEMDRVAKPGCLLATNASTLSIDAIAAATSRPGDVIGLHFFNPANVMRLLEIVRGPRTNHETLATALALGKTLGKVGVVVGDGPGFVGNRMMLPYMYEANYLVEEGATPEQVDNALTGFGMAMGMFAVDDMGGLDVAIRAQKALGHFSDPAERRPLVQPRLVEMGRLGQKTGRGWFMCGEDRKPKPDPEIVELIRREARAAGVRQRSFTDAEIVERLIFMLINEGAKALEDGVAIRASDIDTIYVNGYGFPAWRGGPMFYADRVGLAVIHERLKSFAAEFGARWRPAPLVARLAEQGGTFRDLDAQKRG